MAGSHSVIFDCFYVPVSIHVMLTIMKTVILLIVFCFPASSYLFGKIKNGYEHQLLSARVSLRALRLCLSESTGISFELKQRMKKEIQNLVSYISCYELTEELISQLKMITPDIYMDIDSLKDRKGRPTDVYVKLIPKEKSRLRLEAASFLSQADNDEDASYSDYGPFTASVDIWIGENSLFLLSHELGHIKYIIPNLAVYAKFYGKQYGRSKYINPTYYGHSSHDRSGNSATLFEKKYLKDRATYLKNGGKKFQGLVARFHRLKRNYGNLEVKDPSSIVHAF